MSKLTDRVRSLVKFRYLVYALLAGFILYHSVYFEPLDQHQSRQNQGALQPAEFARDFWANRLLRNLDRAVSASKLLQLFKTDMGTAVQQYGHTLGISSTHSYLVQGQGRITAVGNTGVEVSIEAPSDSADIIIETRDIFGNAVRDASGLLNVSDFKSTMEFNAISVEINKIIRQEVVPEILGQARVGRTIRFVGAAEVNEDNPEIAPLHIVPVQVQFVGQQTS
ncbi:MAG: DUF2291 domain-containing protein [Calditrichota bacterium]